VLPHRSCGSDYAACSSPIPLVPFVSSGPKFSEERSVLNSPGVFSLASRPADVSFFFSLSLLSRVQMHLFARAFRLSIFSPAFPFLSKFEGSGAVAFDFFGIGLSLFIRVLHCLSASFFPEIGGREP